MYRVDWSLLDPAWAKTPKVVAAWAFGSSKEGMVHDGGDIDIGVFFDPGPSLDELAELRALIQSLAHFEEVDLVSLNDAPTILRFEVIRGRSLFCRDKVKRAEYVSLWAREYEDEMAMIKMALRQRR